MVRGWDLPDCVIMLWVSKGFDGDYEAGEASRTGCVKFQIKYNR